MSANKFKSKTLTLIIFFIAVFAGTVTGNYFSGSRIFKPGEVKASKTDLIDMQYTFRAVSEKVLPVVVEITTTEVIQQEMPEGYTWPFNFIEPDDETGDEAPRIEEFESEGLGSGVIVGRDENTYYVLTNNHVIGQADSISVKLYKGESYTAEIVGRDERKDLAMVSFVNEADLDVAVLGSSDELRVGDWVLAVGNPLGYESTVTAGIVSAIGRNGPSDNISDFIQTDASINQGNSGGALVNLDGEVVGINTWIATPNGVSIGLGFAIPVDNVKNAVDDFIESGEVKYGWLGVSITNPDEQTAIDLGIEAQKGALIYNLYEDSPADKAGLLPGDFIIKLNNTEISDYMQFTRLVGDVRAGARIEVKLIREGKIMNIPVTIGNRADRAELTSLYGKIWPGLSGRTLDEGLKKEAGLADSLHGVIIAVEPKTRAAESGLKDYDIITEISGMKINNMMDFFTALNDKKNSSYLIKVLRNSKQVEIELIR